MGILHSLIEKNDGVSIVIDQSIEALVEHLGVPLGNIHRLGALAPVRFNKTEYQIFWHKHEQNECYRLLNNRAPCNRLMLHNLLVLDEKLNHRIVA